MDGLQFGSRFVPGIIYVYISGDQYVSIDTSYIIPTACRHPYYHYRCTPVNRLCMFSCSDVALRRVTRRRRRRYRGRRRSVRVRRRLDNGFRKRTRVHRRCGRSAVRIGANIHNKSCLIYNASCTSVPYAMRMRGAFRRKRARNHLEQQRAAMCITSPIWSFGGAAAVGSPTTMPVRDLQ